MNRPDNEFTTIATKVSKRAAEIFEGIASRMGMSMYELLQIVIDTLIRYKDDRHNLTPDMERAMSIFEHMTGWSGALSLADPTVSLEIQEATYYLADKEGKKKGAKGIHVTRPFFGDWQETANIQEILERTICLLAPERYRRLRALAVDMDCNSLLDLLDAMIDYHTKDEEFKELRRGFEDDDRSDYGRKPAKQRYRRHNKKDIEKEPGQWRPFGVEW